MKETEELGSSVCMHPWSNVLINVERVTVCCGGSPFHLSYEPWKGPWVDGASFWNHPKVVSFRKSMLEDGARKICPNALCAWFGDDGNVFERQKKSFVKGKNAAIYEEMKAGKTVLSTLPTTIYLALNAACNCRCSFCDHYLRYEQLYPTPDQLDKVLEFLSPGAYLSIGGGEPLIESDEGRRILETVMQRCMQKNVSVKVITNGHGLTPEIYEQYCVNGPIVYISLSGHS